MLSEEYTKKLHCDSNPNSGLWICEAAMQPTVIFKLNIFSQQKESTVVWLSVYTIKIMWISKH